MSGRGPRDAFLTLSAIEERRMWDGLLGLESLLVGLEGGEAAATASWGREGCVGRGVRARGREKLKFIVALMSVCCLLLSFVYIRL